MEIDDIVAAVEDARSFNHFRQEIMHLQDKLTDTDIAIRARKLARKATNDNPFNFKNHKKSLEGKTYTEFQEIEGADE